MKPRTVNQLHLIGKDAQRSALAAERERWTCAELKRRYDEAKMPLPDDVRERCERAGVKV